MSPNIVEDLLPTPSKNQNFEKPVNEDNVDNESVANTECTCNELSYGTGDAVFASIIVAPLVVGFWRGTWGLMELHDKLFPYAQIYILGIVIHLCFTLIRSQLWSRSVGAWSDPAGGVGRWFRERVLARIYSYIFALACVMHWRGGWGLFDMTVQTILPEDTDPHRPVLVAAFTILFYMCNICLRSSRNFLAPPYFVVTDGKEATYLYSTRFRLSWRGRGRTPNAALLTPLPDMRGSTAGLADTLAGGSRAHAALLELADVLFASFVVAPAVIVYWKSTWSVVDLYVFPGDPLASAAVSAVFGLCCDFLLCLSQHKLSKYLNPDRGRLTYYVCSRVYTYVAGAASVNAWRGVWNLLNECAGNGPRTTMATTAAAALSLAALRTLRNILASPFAVALDSPGTYFDVQTMFRTNNRDTALYVLDCVFSVTIVGSLVVFVWRGSWELLDVYLYPDNMVHSCWISLTMGYIVVMMTFSLQTPMRWATARLHGAARLLLADTYHLISFVAAVNVWRGIWGLHDAYLFPETPKLSNWCSHIVCFILLILLNCSNSIIVRGVYIDAEEEAGECVVFPCHYLRLFFHKERTKKRHRRALATAAAASSRRSEDASLPLNLPEDKV